MANKEEKTNSAPLIITIASGKGGNGKTTIAINMAIHYSRLGKNVLVIDSVIGFSNINVFLDEVPKYNLYHVIKHHKSMSFVITKSKFAFSYVGSPCGFNPIDLKDKDYLNIINGIKGIKNFDIIIIDTATAITKYILGLINMANEKIIVISPDKLDGANAYGLLKILVENNNDIRNLNIISNRIKIGDEDRMKNIVKNMNKIMK
jgi:flagellar biosynthesis protein FlhG